MSRRVRALLAGPRRGERASPIDRTSDVSRTSSRCVNPCTRRRASCGQRSGSDCRCSSRWRLRSSSQRRQSRPRRATTTPWTTRLSGPRTRWFDEARFGMFIHFGPYAAYRGQYGTCRGAEWIKRRVQHPVERLRGQGRHLQPRLVQRERDRAAGQAGGPEVHRHHLQAPRRLRHVAHPGQPVEPPRPLRLLPRPPARAQGRRHRQRHQARLLLLDLGLARPGLRRRTSRPTSPR